jgi:hypothetical protein
MYRIVKHTSNGGEYFTVQSRGFFCWCTMIENDYADKPYTFKTEAAAEAFIRNYKEDDTKVVKVL